MENKRRTFLTKGKSDRFNTLRNDQSINSKTSRLDSFDFLPTFSRSGPLISGEVTKFAVARLWKERGLLLMISMCADFTDDVNFASHHIFKFTPTWK
jgi:hypothetical protein